VHIRSLLPPRIIFAFDFFHCFWVFYYGIVERPRLSFVATRRAAVPAIFFSYVMLSALKVLYERLSIEAWFKSGKCSSPKTGQVLQITSLIINHNLRRQLHEFKLMKQQ
jgi:hypothetical protein